MLTQALVFLIDTVFTLYSAALLVRFWLQVARTPPRNPISQFVNALTDPVVRPARRFIPGWAGLDLSTLVLAWVTAFVQFLLIRLVDAGAAGTVPVLGLALLAGVAIIRMSLYILMAALILQAILSWVAPYSPVAPLVNGITRPFLKPIQKRLPTVANVDLSPLVLIIVLQLILMVPVRWLTLMVASMFGG